MYMKPDREQTGHGDHAGHEGHADHAAGFRRRFLGSLILTAPVLALSEHIGGALGLGPDAVPRAGLWTALLGTAILLWAGWPFLSGAWAELRARAPGMMLLIATAITVAYAASLAGELGLGGIDVWWELALLVSIMLLGHWLEMRAIGQARGALTALAELLPETAELVEAGGGTRQVAPGDLEVDDVVLVRPGTRVPADGLVIEGRADVDEALVTGESRPVARSEGDRVVAGTVSIDGALRVRVTEVGEQTALAGIRRLVEDAQSSRSRAQVLADRAAAALFYLAVGAAALTAITWTALGDPDAALTLAATVLIIACPHALGLAIPLVVSISTTLASRRGILVRDRLALERMRQVDTVLFDKTGTLTAGAHTVTDAVALDGDAEGMLRLAAAVERDSEHPLARAIRSAAGDDVPSAAEPSFTPGEGMRGVVDGRAVAVGGPGLLRAEGLDAPPELADMADRARARGAGVLWVIADGAVAGAVQVEDAVRPESREAVDGLHAEGVRVVMITGDAHQVAAAVAGDLGIDEVHAEVLPSDKDRVVQELRDRGRVVAMVGDGINDAPALSRADVGLAIGAGTDVAIESAGIVLASDDPRGVLAVRRLSAASYRTMVQNLWWGAGYNIVAIPLAAGVLAPIGILLPMAVGAILMSASTVIVAVNAQTLRRLELAPAS